MTPPRSFPVFIGHLGFSPSEENIGGTSREEECQPGVVEGYASIRCVVRFPLTHPSSGEIFGGHSAWGCHRSHRCRKEASGWIRPSQSHPRDHLRHRHQFQSPFTTHPRSPSLTDPPTGNCRCQEQGQNPSLTHSHTGGTFRNASWRRGRAEAPWRAFAVRRYSPIKLGAEPLSASSRTSKDSCSPYQRRQDCNDPLTMLKSVKIYSSSSKIYKMPPLTIRSVHHLIVFSMLTKTTGSGL